MENTILIVDDMTVNIEILAAILDDKYIVIPAEGGAVAMKLLESRKPDLVLLDVSMPDIDGFDVLEYMKASKDLANIPVIFVTGEHDAYVEEKGLALGAVDYIKKPFNAAVIVAKVRNHLELKAYRDNLELLVWERTKQLQERTVQLASSREAIIMGMSLMSESHDNVTGEHIRRIKSYTRMLTNKMLELYPELLTPEMAKQIELFSPLHDVGKISISDTILKKTGVLTQDEFKIMESHTVEGAKLLTETASFLTDSSGGGDLKVAIEIAECHHEKFDGAGYPRGYKGEEIPLSARIVTVTDIYDALRSDRPYKKGFSHEQAIDIILNGDGRTMPSHFDPIVLETFRAVHGEFNRIFS